MDEIRKNTLNMIQEAWRIDDREDNSMNLNINKVWEKNFGIEFLEITEKDYISGDFKNFFRSPRYEVNVSNNKQLKQVINKALEEGWEELCLYIHGAIDIPAEIGQLVCLKSLILEGTDNKSAKIIKLPQEIGNLKKLESFHAYGCNIIELPDTFSQLENLKKLNLNNNNFVEFPKEIFTLIKLESLAINMCFTILPDEICNLTNLKYLYLPNANIEKLPENIGNLVDLEILCIWGTKINVLPDSCLKLNKLKSLYLTKSLYADILPPEITSQSPIDAINYIIRYQNDVNKVEVNESKMIIVGQGGVGKTCLLNRLIYDRYDETVSTEGIDIATWQFEVDNKIYKLNVWDFGGQEIYHSTHQFFLTKRSLYIFVWDARQEEEYGRIDYWLHTIESFAFDSPIIIVINKCDSRKSIKQLDLKSIKEKFPQIIDSFKVSCKENIEIEHLRNIIEEETIKLPLMGMVWLSSWLDVRIELESLAQIKNIITYSEYLMICKKYNILPSEALSLSKYLHDLGIIINFQNDVFLKNIVILNPDWGTNAVYKVLDAQETVLRNRNGILFYKDLSQIWRNDDEYPEDIYPVILRLMENFQLSFEVKKNNEYLIAELLESEELSVKIDSSKKQILDFQYNYDFLPAGIMTRFIVKANEYLLEEKGKKLCWKKGAYLNYENSIGMVKLFDGISERKIEIKVIGKSSRENRELLILIRKFFDDIHKSVPKIKYKEYVKCNCRTNCTYLHDYSYLLRLEDNRVITERCKNSLKTVNVPKLLDGINIKRKSKRRNGMRNIQVNPHIVIENNNTSSNENDNSIFMKNVITIQIRNNITQLHGSINDLKEEIVYEHPEMEEEFAKLEKCMKKIGNANTKDEIVMSGAMSKIRRFLEEIQSNNSKIGKIVREIKYGISIAQEIGDKYNSIAEWCGMPIIPRLLLKK